MLFLGIAIFVLVLAKVGRIGPFVWDSSYLGRRPAMAHRVAAPVRGSRPAGALPSPTETLQQRLVDGDITSDEYLERLSLIQGS
ncbi:MAG: hypothetical protein ACK5LN_09970 [Propioniciclava sp.]